MTDTDRPTTDRHGAGRYEIRLSGRLDARWAAAFDGLRLSDAGDGTTRIEGPVADQAALHGLLQTAAGPGPAPGLGHADRARRTGDPAPDLR